MPAEVDPLEKVVAIVMRRSGKLGCGLVCALDVGSGKSQRRCKDFLSQVM